MTLDITYKMQREVEDVLNNSFNYSTNPLPVLEQWKRNKEHFYRRFGNQLIIHSDLIELEANKTNQYVRDFQQFKNYIYSRVFNNPEMSAIREFIEEAVGPSGFKDNQVKKNWSMSENGQPYLKEMFKEKGLDYSKIKVNKGMKFSKSLGLFLRKEDKNILREMQDNYSTYRQNFSSKSEGRIFLSIHPLDYLTISDNNHNWSSCHSMDYGEFRAGNLNFMADGVTMVAYYTSDNRLNEELDVGDNLKWNSKRWRALVHVKEENGELSIIYNKQYPFDSDQLLGELDKFVSSLYETANPSEFMTYEDERLGSKIIYEMNGSMCCYIDINRHNGCHVRMSNSLIEGADMIIPIGEEINCLYCGNEKTYNGDTGMCEECSGELYCDDCGGLYYGEDMIEIDETGEILCYDCHQERYFECEECGEIFERSHERFNNVLKRTWCASCEKEKMEESAVISLIYDRQPPKINAKSKATEEFYEKIFENILEARRKVLSSGQSLWSIGISDSELIQSPIDEQNVYNGVYNLRTLSDTNYYQSADDKTSVLEILKERRDNLPNFSEVIISGLVKEEELNNAIETMLLIAKKDIKIDTTRVELIEDSSLEGRRENWV